MPDFDEELVEVDEDASDFFLVGRSIRKVRPSTSKVEALQAFAASINVNSTKQ